MGSLEGPHRRRPGHDCERHHSLSVALQEKRFLSVDSTIPGEGLSRSSRWLARRQCKPGPDRVQSEVRLAENAGASLHDLGREEGCGYGIQAVGRRIEARQILAQVNAHSAQANRFTPSQAKLPLSSHAVFRYEAVPVTACSIGEDKGYRAMSVRQRDYHEATGVRTRCLTDIARNPLSSPI